MRIDFLNDVALGKIESENVLLERSRLYEINMHVHYIAYVVSYDSDANRPIKADYFEKTVEDAFIPLGRLCVCWTHQSNVNVFVPIQPTIDGIKKHSVAMGQLVYRYIANKVEDFTFSVGIGSYYENNINLCKSYAEALQAVQIGKIDSTGAGVCHFDDIGMYQILLPLAGTEAAARYVDTFLGRLIKYDKSKNTQFIQTLEQYIKCNSLGEAATKLYVHPKTMALRKLKIEEILGISLKSEEVRLALLAAIMLYKTGE